jgi:hypothetical protein
MRVANPIVDVEKELQTPNDDEAVHNNNADEKDRYGNQRRFRFGRNDDEVDDEDDDIGMSNRYCYSSRTQQQSSTGQDM